MPGASPQVPAPEAADVPVPGDDSSQTPGVQPLPWSSIPKFVPGTTNVQEYTQKLRFLAAMWPPESLHLLAPRAALLVEGTAFKKVARLDPAKLKVGNQTGIALLVDAIGGSWGSTDLEEKYEYFERALYGTVQRADESHDSYLSRMEANFTELLARGTKIEEVQAYVLLRQSVLPPDDKKKILLENVDLQYKPAVKAFRLLGSKFFHELQGSRTSTKTRVYDAHLAEVPPWEESPDDPFGERAFAAMTEEPEGDFDPDFLEIMIASEDHDALTIQAFSRASLKVFSKMYLRCMMPWSATWKLVLASQKRSVLEDSGPSKVARMTTDSRARAGAKASVNGRTCWRVSRSRHAGHVANAAIGRPNVPTGPRLMG